VKGIKMCTKFPCCYNCWHFCHGLRDVEDPYDERINHCHYPSKGGHRFDNELFTIDDHKCTDEISPKCPMTQEEKEEMFKTTKITPEQVEELHELLNKHFDENKDEIKTLIGAYTEREGD
jgi:hypothetical protein